MSSPAEWRIFRRGKSPYQRKPGPPENAVVSGLRKAIPFVVGGDFVILALLVARIVVSLDNPGAFKVMITTWSWLFDMVPTGGVMLTGMVAVFLVASRLASIESDRSNAVLIKDKQLQKERKESLNLQAKICTRQMILAFSFILAYVAVSSIPGFFNIDPSQGGGRLVVLILTVAEFSIPLLNMRTFAIVEESLKQLDIITAGIYEASNAAMMMLRGIGTRAEEGQLDKADRRVLKLTADGKLNQALDSRADVDYGIDADAKYISLRLLATGVRDGDMLDAVEWQRWHDAGEPRDDKGRELYDRPQETRYNRALNTARRIRDSARRGYERVQLQIKAITDLPKDDQDAKKLDELRAEEKKYLDILQQFDRGAHNSLLVSEAMGGRIIGKLGSYRTRKRKPRAAIQPVEEGIPALAISGTPSE